jgi:hypothetical protein
LRNRTRREKGQAEDKRKERSWFHGFLLRLQPGLSVDGLMSQVAIVAPLN